MNESECAAALKTHIMDALRAHEFIDRVDDRNIWTTQVLDNATGILTGGNTPDMFAGRMARNLVSIFGDRAMSLIGPVVVINKTYNLYQHSEISKALADFELMQSMKEGGKS